MRRRTRSERRTRGTRRSYSWRLGLGGDGGTNKRKRTGGSRRRTSNGGGRLRMSRRGGSRGTIGGDSISRRTAMTRSISKRRRRSN